MLEIYTGTKLFSVVQSDFTYKMLTFDEAKQNCIGNKKDYQNYFLLTYYKHVYYVARMMRYNCSVATNIYCIIYIMYV